MSNDNATPDNGKKEHWYEKYGKATKLPAKYWALMIGMVALFTVVWSVYIIAKP